MPNWCGNTLSVRGTPDELRRFRAENAFKGKIKTQKVHRGKLADSEEEVDKPLSFEMHLPTPEEFRGKPSPPPGHKMVLNELSGILGGTVEPYDWYTWRLANWGTKWDLSTDTSVTEDYDDGLLQYGFDTAWSPPILWLTSVSEKYPDLTFHLQYEEGGCDFEGYMKVAKGEIVEEREGTYSRCYECGSRKCDCPPEKKKGES